MKSNGQEEIGNKQKSSENGELIIVIVHPFVTETKQSVTLAEVTVSYKNPLIRAGQH